MASIQEALASLRQEIGGQQGRPLVARDDAQYDPTVPPPPPPSQSAPQAMPFTLHKPLLGGVFDGVPVARLPAKFRMPDIERRELEGLRQRSDEFISSFISHRQGKIAEIVDRPLQRDDSVLMVIRGLIRGLGGKFRPNWSGPYFIRELTPEGAAWLMDLDGNRLSGPTNVDQLKRLSQVHGSWGSLYVLHFIYEGMSFDHWVFESSFLSFLSPYHLGLRYVPCLKTTLRPWDQMSSSAASIGQDISHFIWRFMDPHRFARSLSLIGCSLRCGHDRYLTEPLRSIQLVPHFSMLGCHHASPSGRSSWIYAHDSVMDSDDQYYMFDDR
ncbi:hypothetical protein CK203_045685 [Vitis vinifera]|uniref:Uncharacterized protein n=1 Tax=Vitis vinifera TaxID=29760 RepID=A0A438HQ84_VITVI|nr:hypothetical protein CK203_045685 [Vitis vinifera]